MGGVPKLVLTQSVEEQRGVFLKPSVPLEEQLLGIQWPGLVTPERGV
jgi:hypothetical protein